MGTKGKDMEARNGKTEGVSPFLILGLCGVLLAGVAIGAAVMPWMAEKIAGARSPSGSAVGSYVDVENMLDKDGNFIILDYPAEVVGSYVELPDLDSVTVDPVERPSVTDDDVRSNVESYMLYYGKETYRTEGTVAMGDSVRVTYSVSVDGEPLEGYSGEDVILDMGSGLEPVGFSDAVVGTGIGEEITFTASFGEDWPDEDVRGMEAEFTVLVSGVREFPEVTDANVSDLTEGEFDTAADFMSYIRKSLEDYDWTLYREEVYGEIQEALMAGTTFKPMPRAMTEWYVSVQMKYYQTASEKEGVTIGEYLEKVGLGDNPDKVANSIAGVGDSVMRRYALLMAVADAAGISVDPEDEADKELIEERMEELRYGIGLESADELAGYYRLSNVYNDVRNQKTIDWLVSNIRQEASGAEDGGEGG